MLWHESDVRGFVPMSGVLYFSVASHVPALRSPQRQLELAGLPCASALINFGLAASLQYCIILCFDIHCCHSHA